jgi:hypothetical protein
MPKKVKRGKKKASTEKTDKISINIKNIIQQARTEQRRPKSERQATKRRQAPDIIRPLGKRPIEASAFDNQYRLQNPSVTYASTPLANMASLRDLIQAPSAPQVTGQLALRQQPPATNPNQIVPRLQPSQRAVSPANVSYNIDMRSITPVRNPYTSPQLLWEASHRPVGQPQFQPGPIIGQSLESIAENTSQRLVAEQMDQDSRNYAQVASPPRSSTVRPIARAESPTLPGVPPIARASASRAGPVSRPVDPNVRRITSDMIEHPHHPQHAEWKKEQARLKKAEKARFKIVRPLPTLIDA